MDDVLRRLLIDLLNDLKELQFTKDFDWFKKQEYIILLNKTIDKNKDEEEFIRELGTALWNISEKNIRNIMSLISNKIGIK